MKLGLHARLGLLFAAFGVLATGLTGLYAYRQARELLVQAAERDLLVTTQVFGHRMTAVFSRIAADARESAQWRLSRNIAAAGADAQQQALLADTFKAMLDTNPRYFQVRLISAGGHGLELVRVDRDGGGALEVTGDALQEKAHFPYVFRTLQLARGEVFLSKIGIHHEAGSHAALNQPTLHVASPVVDDAGRTLGVVVIGVDVRRVFDELRAALPPYMKLMLANQWGDFLIHPDPSQAFAFDQGRRVLLQETFPTVEPLLRGVAQPVLERAQLNDGRLVQPVLGAFVQAPLAPEARESEVVLGIAEPLDDILRSARALARETAQIVAACSAVAIGLAILLARLVTRPLKQMTREVRRFSAGSAMGELPTARRDELGELARGFHEMQHKVRASMAELQASREHLADQARRDPLTGLHNRTGFLERLEHSIAAARRQGHALALLFVDLDRFKRVNDLHGHAVGDQALKQAAQRLRSVVREVDTVGRLGGDEFVILLEAVNDERDAGRVAQALIECFAEPVEVGGVPIELGLSVGISLFPRDGSDVASLMERADEAMYHSKSGAGNRYSVFGNL
ncbi:MAG: diguanylate cyclase [Pseudomonadota bacterium]